MFTVEERDRVREHVELARGDARVVAGAEVGSLALGGGDRWSDLDLTFGIADGVAVTEILDNWTSDLVSRFDAVHLFDLVADPAVYRVSLLADYLQLDVSVAPASKFRSTSPRFKLLFGETNEPEYGRPRRVTTHWAGRCSGLITHGYASSASIGGKRSAASRTFATMGCNSRACVMTARVLWQGIRSIARRGP